MLIGVVPFGLVAGTAPVSGGLGTEVAAGFSMVVFAGASQLAAIEILVGGGSALVAVAAVCTINMRMLLYSASIAPHLSEEPLPQRLAAAYLLTDEAYAVSVARWADGLEPRRRLPYFLGAGLLLWATWQVCTVAGALVGAAVPEDLPLDFAVPLVFLVVLVPTLVDRPSLVAAAAGGLAAVVAGEAGAGPMLIIIGAVVGIAAGTAADAHLARRRFPGSAAGPP